MKKELLKLQARNREINDRLTTMYVKAENEKREFNEDEQREERELKRELESNHREIMLSGDAAAIGALREQQDKSAQLREFFKAVKEKRENATTILNNPVTTGGDQNVDGNLTAGNMIPLNIKELIDTKVEGLELPADLTMLTGVVGDEVWPYSIDDAEVRVAGEVDTIAEQGLNFANVKALSERVACAIAISNKAIDNAYFDLYSFVLYKIQKAVAILKAKRVYSHAKFGDNLVSPFSKVDVEEVVLDENIGQTLAEKAAEIYDLGFEGIPYFTMDKVMETKLQFTKLLSGLTSDRTVVQDGKCVGYPMTISGHINGHLDGNNLYEKEKGVHYIGIGHYRYLAFEQHGEVRLTVDSQSAAVSARNSTVVTLNMELSLTELSQLVNGNKSGKPQAFKLLKVVESVSNSDI
jgi:hypothetical protein